MLQELRKEKKLETHIMLLEERERERECIRIGVHSIRSYR